MVGRVVTGAILWAFAAAGFWTVGHWQGSLYYDPWTCEAARPFVEADMRARGYVGIHTICVEIRDRG